MYSRKELVQEAFRKALQLRQECRVGLTDAVCIYDLAEANGIREVRFVEISGFEEMYCRERACILVSSLRPTGRRAFNCAHGFGHHVFGHGNCITSVSVNGSQPHFNEQEFLADAFASAFLMPRTTVSHAFSSRGWPIQQATCEQFYVVASWLGVGYETLISHMRDTLRLIPSAQAALLLKKQPKQIRAELIGAATNNNVLVVDQHWTGRPVDLAVGDILIVPQNADVESNDVELVEWEGDNKLYRAISPGMQSRVEIGGENWSAFIRVSRFQYHGRNIFRHLEDPDYAS
jgi:Zn-dependent peptidase ImmA (M78 family)